MTRGRESSSVTEDTPFAGEAAALAAARGAALVAVAAAEHPAVRAQARTLRRRAESWGREDAVALAEARLALAARQGDDRLADALERARLAPLAIAELGADVAALAVAVHEDAHPDVEPEVVAAAALGAAAARIGAHLVAVNLATLERSAELERARDAARRAEAACATLSR
jgi:formiminotetrahydrofolate cyclodeaminase